MKTDTILVNCVRHAFLFVAVAAACISVLQGDMADYQFHARRSCTEYQHCSGKTATVANLLSSICVTNAKVPGEEPLAFFALQFIPFSAEHTNAVVTALRHRADHETACLPNYFSMMRLQSCARLLLKFDSGIPHGVSYLRAVVTNSSYAIKARLEAAMPLVRAGVLDGYELLSAALNYTNYSVRSTAERLLCAYAPYDGAHASSGQRVNIQEQLAGIRTPASALAPPPGIQPVAASGRWWHSLPHADKIVFQYPLTPSVKLSMASNSYEETRVLITTWSNRHGYLPALATNMLATSRMNMQHITDERPHIRTDFPY